MKKIGIITIHKSPNYGASLQAFALWKFLENEGYDVEIIDLYRSFFKGYIPSKRFTPPSKFRGETLIQTIKRHLRSMKQYFHRNSKQQNNKLGTPDVFVEPKLAIRRFEQFNSAIRYSQPICGYDELYNNPPHYDVYISGSDQIWNPTLGICLEPYFLTFVKQGKKISYASSLGVSELTKKEKKKYRKWLKSYSFISVREQQAKRILDNILNNNIYQVADPTFLLDKSYWESLAVKPAISDYILLFPLEYQANLVEYASKISKECGKKLVVICQRQPVSKTQDYIPVIDAGPKEFLGYVENAEMVIGDSFHCSVFSIILGANNFYTYISPWNVRGSRIVDLLKTYQLENHLLNPELKQSWYDLCKNKIDREQLMKIAKDEQIRSRKLLLDNI